MNIIDWISTNWKSILDIIAYGVALASVVVKLTPNTNDDTILKKVIDILNALALNPERELKEKAEKING